VAAAQVLHERVTCGQDPASADSSHPDFRPERASVHGTQGLEG
jgi:hypothetical protein